MEMKYHEIIISLVNKKLDVVFNVIVFSLFFIPIHNDINDLTSHN